MRRIAVLGSNSFSGSDFIDLLLEDPENQVLGLSRSPEKGSLFLPYLRHGSARFHFHQADLNLDLTDLMAQLNAFEPEYIVNFAAQSEVAPSWKHPDHWYQTNVVALSKLIQGLLHKPWLKRYVHISSPEVYGSCSGTVREDAPFHPSTPYAVSKAAADLHLAAMARSFDFPLVTIRATNVYGAHQQLFKIIPRTVISLKRGATISLHGGGQAVKSYIHIRDISRGEVAAMLKGQDGATYHLSPDQGVEVRGVVARICALMGQDFAQSTRDVEERLGQDAAYVIDSTRARQELGWSPTIALTEGLAQVVAWVEDQWDGINQETLDYVHKA